MTRNLKIVGVAMASLDGALCCISRSIRPTIAELFQAMPVLKKKPNTCIRKYDPKIQNSKYNELPYIYIYTPMNGNVVLSVVGDIGDNVISFSDINGRSWKHPIYCNDWLGMAQPAHILHLNLRPNKDQE